MNANPILCQIDPVTDGNLCYEMLSGPNAGIPVCDQGTHNLCVGKTRYYLEIDADVLAQLDSIVWYIVKEDETEVLRVKDALEVIVDYDVPFDKIDWYLPVPFSQGYVGIYFYSPQNPGYYFIANNFVYHVYVCEPVEAGFTQSDTIVCVGDCIHYFDTSRNGATSWEWHFEGGDPEYSSEKNPEVCYPVTGSYRVSLKVRSFNTDTGMAYTDFIEHSYFIQVMETPSFSADILQEIEVLPSELTTLHSCGSGDYYRWQPELGLSCYDCPHPDVIGTDISEYRCEFFNDEACILHCTYHLTYITEGVYFPSAFSPNGDGINDRYRAVHRGNDVDDFSMKIYNRWGNIVYSSESINEGWDGFYKGEIQDIGLYVYVVDYVIQGNRSTAKGNLTLVR